jgi:hypothetical protein
MGIAGDGKMHFRFGYFEFVTGYQQNITSALKGTTISV